MGSWREIWAGAAAAAACPSPPAGSFTATQGGFLLFRGCGSTCESLGCCAVSALGDCAPSCTPAASGCWCGLASSVYCGGPAECSMRRLLGDLPDWMSSSRYWVVRPWAGGCSAARCDSPSTCDWTCTLVGAGSGGSSLGVGSTITARSCVAAGVGNWAGVDGATAGALEDWGSACGSAVDAGVSGAGVDDGTGVEPGTEAAAGRRRAALGANFLPVVFSSHDLAQSVPWGDMGRRTVDEGTKCCRGLGSRRLVTARSRSRRRAGALVCRHGGVGARWLISSPSSHWGERWRERNRGRGGARPRHRPHLRGLARH